MTRYRTVVEDGTVYVESEAADDVDARDRLAVGTVDDVLDAIGSHSWTITYTEAEKARRPEMDTADEGLTIDVLDAMRAMTHGERFVRTLSAHPVETPGEGTDVIAPRTGLFVGKLLENLENGLE